MYMIAGVSQYVAVASFMEAWIEIDQTPEKEAVVKVASFMEAWIEILLPPPLTPVYLVASFMEAWIEIFTGVRNNSLSACRLLHGGVD